VVSLSFGAACAAGASGCDPFNEPEPVGLEARTSSGEPTADDAGGAASQPEVDTVAVLTSIADGGYRGTGFTHATSVPYASAVATGSMVDEWVSSGSYAEYSKVQPAASGSGALMPVGSVVVRAVMDPDAGVTKLTVMLKGPAGYNPALGDWWFAETDPWGTPLTDDAGVLAGKLTDCYGCHLPRSGDDYVFGVPLDDRPPEN
jgi:hypothetical protein